MSARICMPMPHPETAHKLCSFAHAKTSHQAQSQLLTCTCASCNNTIFSVYLLVPHKQGASSRCAVCALQVSLPASSEHCLAQARVMAKMAVLLKAVPGKDVREKVSCSCLCCCTWHGVGGCFWPSDLSGLRVQTMNIKHSAH